MARRIVTGHDANGKSIFVQTASKSGPGFVMVEVWATDSPPALPVKQNDRTADLKAFIPPLTGSASGWWSFLRPVSGDYLRKRGATLRFC